MKFTEKYIKRFEKFIKNLNVMNLEKDKLVKIKIDRLTIKQSLALSIMTIGEVIFTVFILYKVIKLSISCSSIISELNAIHSLKSEVIILSELMLLIFVIMMITFFLVVSVIRKIICIIKELLIYNEKIIININNKKDIFYFKEVDTTTKFIKKNKYNSSELYLLSNSLDNLLKHSDNLAKNKNTVKYKFIDYVFKVALSTGTLIFFAKLIWIEIGSIESIMSFKKNIRYVCFKLNSELIFLFIIFILMMIVFIYFFIEFRKLIRDVSDKKIRILERIQAEMNEGI